MVSLQRHTEVRYRLFAWSAELGDHGLSLLRTTADTWGQTLTDLPYDVLSRVLYREAKVWPGAWRGNMFPRPRILAIPGEQSVSLNTPKNGPESTLVQR